MGRALPMVCIGLAISAAATTIRKVAALMASTMISTRFCLASSAAKPTVFPQHESLMSSFS